MSKIAILATCVSISCYAPAAMAGTELSEEVDINNGLLILAVADKIRRECNTISGRLFRARSFANDLEEIAERRGYNENEIDAYLNDSAQKAKVREQRNAYFDERGASNLDPESLCVLGREEIAQGSHVGYLLKAK